MSARGRTPDEPKNWTRAPPKCTERSNDYLPLRSVFPDPGTVFHGNSVEFLVGERKREVSRPHTPRHLSVRRSHWTHPFVILGRAGDLDDHDKTILERMIGAMSGLNDQVVIPALAIAALTANPRLTDEARDALVSRVAARFEVAA